mgnify:CR=1 FL=1
MSKAHKGQIKSPNAYSFPKGHKINLGKKNHLGFKHSKEARKKMSDALKGRKLTEQHKEKIRKYAIEHNTAKRMWGKGDKAPNWRGGKTPLIRLIRGTSKYKQWRSDIFKRDNFKCIICGKKGRLVVDHFPIKFSTIIHFKDIKTIEEALDCKWLWDKRNGRTLCHDCHIKTYNYGGRKPLEAFIEDLLNEQKEEIEKIMRRMADNYDQDDMIKYQAIQEAIREIKCRKLIHTENQKNL